MDLYVSIADSGDYNRVAPSTTRYRIVEASIHLGLSLLESQHGRRSLVEVATAVINARDAKRAHHLYRDSMDRMPYWIGRFLSSMRTNFPEAAISPDVHGEAEARRHEWTGTMGEYDAGSAGVLFLSKALIDNMVNARQQPAGAYELFKFQMAISIAHEVVHFLVGFLTGTTRPDTPPTVTLARYGNTRRGEAGRYWEGNLFGGILEFWGREDDPQGSRQVGTPYIFEDGRRGSPGHLVSLGYTREFNNQDFSFPMRTSTQSRPTTRDILTSQGYSETSTFRRPVRVRTARLESPPPDDPSFSVAFRRLPRSSAYYADSGSSSQYSGRRR